MISAIYFQKESVSQSKGGGEREGREKESL